MRKKIFITLILIVLCSSMTMYSFATTVTDLKNQQSQAQSNKKDLEDEKQQIQAEQDEALAKINELSTQISSSEEELEKLNSKVKELDSSIKTTEKELAESERKQKEQQEALEQRLVAQYKAGKTTYLDVLLNSTSLSKFISNYYLVGKVAKADNELLEQIAEEKEKIEKTKANLEKQQSEIKIAKADAEKENVKLKNAKAQKNSQVAKLDEEKKSIQQQIDEYDKKMSDLEAQIRKAQEANKSSGGTKVTYNGVMAWPVPGYTKITSTYGMRIHPIYKVQKMHNGIDIGGAPWGAPFVAADDGIVIQASDKGNGYGLCVVIDHGGGISTLYGHGSAVYVSVGQKVTKGQKVLGIGSSGVSTGKHAHFEVRVGGKAVNPIPYVT